MSDACMDTYKSVNTKGFKKLHKYIIFLHFISSASHHSVLDVCSIRKSSSHPALCLNI